MGTLSQGVEGVTAQSSFRRRALASAEYAPWVSTVVFYVIFANIPYWIASREFHFAPLGIFCFQYATVGLIALVFPRFIPPILLFLLTFADILCGICETYCVPIRECLENIRAAHAFSLPHFLEAISIVLLALITASTAAIVPGRSLTWRQRGKAAAVLATFIVLVLGTDVVMLRLASGHMPILVKTIGNAGELDSGAPKTFRLARVPILRLIRLEKIDADVHARELSAINSPVPSASGAAIKAAGIFSATGNRQLPNIVLVLVESWGLPLDPSLYQATVEPYLEPGVLAKYQVLQGTAPSFGTTIPGEGRELCGSSISFAILDAPASALKSCLPTRLAALGYQPIAVHGMGGFLFDRANWYHTIGFQEVWFHDDLQKQGLTDCADAFVGICDADIAGWIGRRLDQDGSRPYFIHWITLNSHLPLPVPTTLANPAPCDASPTLGQRTAVCSWYQLIMNVNRSVAQAAESNLARPTIFVIVGDHAPPFGNPTARDLFSQTDVPYVVLMPRSLADANKNLLAHNAANNAVAPIPSAAANPHASLAP